MCSLFIDPWFLTLTNNLPQSFQNIAPIQLKCLSQTFLPQPTVARTGIHQKSFQCHCSMHTANMYTSGMEDTSRQRECLGSIITNQAYCVKLHLFSINCGHSCGWDLRFRYISPQKCHTHTHVSPASPLALEVLAAGESPFWSSFLSSVVLFSAALSAVSSTVLFAVLCIADRSLL